MILKSYSSLRLFPRLVLAALALCSLACGQQAKAVSDEIDSKGAASVVKKLNSSNGSQWKALIRGIETGAPEWLVVARKLSTATDAGRTTDLYFALSLALTRNAEGVLSILGPNLPVEKVCTVPYIEPDEKTIRTYRLKARSSLRKVTSAELESKKKACLKALEQ